MHTDYRLSPGCNFADDRPSVRTSLADFLLAEVEAPRFVRQLVAIAR